MLQTQEDIFNEAWGALRKIYAPVPIQLDVLGTEMNQGPDMIQIDKLIRLLIGENRIQYFVEIKNNFTQANLGQMLFLRNQVPGPWLLITKYINDAMGENLKKNNIEFIDTAGNAHINQPPLFVYIKGQKLKNHQNTLRGQAFRPTGLKVIFIFLCHPNMINEKYRTIAHAAGVALGNIGWIMNDLKTQGFILDMGKRGFKLINKRQLLDRFIEEYPRKLRPQLLLGNFTGDQDWWKKDCARIGNALWGGEIAAADMENFLKPQNVTIYIRQPALNDFLLKNRLKRDPAGDVEILKEFWNPTNLVEQNGNVHPILVYADLIATGIQRNIETAKVIYEQEVKRHIRED